MLENVDNLENISDTNYYNYFESVFSYMDSLIEELLELQSQSEPE